MSEKREKISIQHKNVDVLGFLNHEKARIEKIFSKTPNKIDFFSIDEAQKNSDLIITLGGDGTLIGTARKLKRKAPPLFGINLGKLGFISEFSKIDFYDYLGNTLKMNYETFNMNIFCAEIIEKT